MLAVKYFYKENKKIIGACNNSFTYPLNKWMHVNGIEMCERGFHLPRRIRDIESFGGWFDGYDGRKAIPFLVNIKGDFSYGEEDDKFVVSDIKLIKELPTFDTFEGKSKRDRIRAFTKWLHLEYPDLFYYNRSWNKKFIKDGKII